MKHWHLSGLKVYLEIAAQSLRADWTLSNLTHTSYRDVIHVKINYARRKQEVNGAFVFQLASIQLLLKKSKKKKQHWSTLNAFMCSVYKYSSRTMILGKVRFLDLSIESDNMLLSGDRMFAVSNHNEPKRSHCIGSDASCLLFHLGL